MKIIEYLSSLFLTIIIESFIAFLFGFKKAKFLWLISANFITHSLLNLLNFVYNYFIYTKIIRISLAKFYNTFGLLICIEEIIVVVIEFAILKFATNEKTSKLLAMSFLMNLLSFACGILLIPVFINS